MRPFSTRTRIAFILYEAYGENVEREPASGAERSDAANDCGDPDGIRTRVTCVKGGCPRPLDDGVSILGGERSESEPRRSRTFDPRLKRPVLYH